MEELLLMTGMFVVGAGAGAVLSYVRDRRLLHLYGHLVEELSGMVSHQHHEPPESRAVAARIPEMPPITDAAQKRAS